MRGLPEAAGAVAYGAGAGVIQYLAYSAVAAALAFGGGTLLGMGIGEDREFAKRAREDAIVQKVQDAATLSAAEAIAKIKPRNTIVRQETEREIRTQIQYGDCRNAPGVMRNINEALTGKQEPAGDRKLPGTVAPDR